MDDPAYEEGDKGDLMLTLDPFPDDWSRDDSVNENYDGVFLSADETIIVLASVEIEEAIEDAEGSFETSRSGFRDPQDYEIGDEAFWDTSNDQFASTIFRHSNALGHVAAARESGMNIVPDESRSQNFAGEMCDSW